MFPLVLLQYELKTQIFFMEIPFVTALILYQQIDSLVNICCEFAAQFDNFRCTLLHNSPF